jgi:hypothetical protein
MPYDRGMTTQGGEDVTDSVLADAQTRLDHQAQEDEAPLQQLGEKEAHLLGGLYTYPDRKWREHIEAVDAEIPAGEAQMAARVGQGEEAALLKDEEEAKADGEMIQASSPWADPTGSAPGALVTDASGILAEIDKDLDTSMKDSIELNADAQEAREAARDHDSASAHAEAADAQALLADESSMLADADRALAKLEAEMRAAGEQPPPHQD